MAKDIRITTPIVIAWYNRKSMTHYKTVSASAEDDRIVVEFVPFMV